MRKLVILALAVIALAVWAWVVQNSYGVAVAFLIPFAVFVYLTAVSKGVFSGLWITAATIAIGVSLAEIVLFVLAPDAPKLEPITGRYTGGSYFVRSPWGSVSTEGTYDAARADGEGGVAYSVEYTIGADGFRITPSAGDDTDLTFFMGGSFTFGEGLENNETLPYYFGETSGSAVANFGFHGYGMHQALKILRLRPAENVARIVVQTIPWHAERSACVPLFGNGSPKYARSGGSLVEIGQCGTKIPRVARAVLGRSSLYVSVRDAVQEIARDRDAEFALYIDLLKELDSIARDKFSARFVVAFIKAREDYFAGTSYSNGIIVDALRQAGIDVVDITLADSQENVAPAFRIRGDGHPSSLANQDRAALLVDYFSSSE